jgi:hypothetical protein
MRVGVPRPVADADDRHVEDPGRGDELLADVAAEIDAVAGLELRVREDRAHRLARSAGILARISVRSLIAVDEPEVRREDLREPRADQRDAEAGDAVREVRETHGSPRSRNARCARGNCTRAYPLPRSEAWREDSCDGCVCGRRPLRARRRRAAARCPESLAPDEALRGGGGRRSGLGSGRGNRRDELGLLLREL